MTEREIPTLRLDFDINEETDAFYFNCPITGENVADMAECPEELVFYYDNLDSECTYLNSWAEKLSEAYEALPEEEQNFDLKDYILEKLPADKKHFLLIVAHPMGVGGDFIELLYEGEYKGRVNNYVSNVNTQADSFPHIPLFHIEYGEGSPNSTPLKSPTGEDLCSFETPPSNLVIHYKNWDDNRYQSDCNNKPPFTYLNEKYSQFWEDYQNMLEESDDSEYINFLHYLMDALPQEKNFFRLLISDRFSPTEDYELLVYEGSYSY
jgi:hypothetical protein